MNTSKQNIKRSGAEKPLILIVMGVSGCGKTTLAQQLGNALNIQALDADDFHSAENKAHMASGQPMSDHMRLPWVNTLREHLMREAGEGKSTVLAFSGLRRAHRNLLRIEDADVLFFFLNGTKSVIEKRLKLRQNHFMPSSLLDSQLDSLENPNEENDVVKLDITLSIPLILNGALTELAARNLK